MNCLENRNNDPYYMVTAKILEEEIIFDSQNAFDEAIKVGFFRIKTPSDLDLEKGRLFAKTFTSIPRYNSFGVLDVVNGYLQSEKAQTVRFSLDQKNWNKCHIGQKEVEDGEPNYPLEIQDLGLKLNEIGIKVLRTILRKHIPESLWFKATAGCSSNKGSHFLLFNCYDPLLSSRPDGVGAHKDWSYVTVLDASEPGLEAKIDGIWRSLHVEDGYLIINFGYPLQKLLPSVNASEHRVVTQKEKMRTSTVVFCDPLVGPREGAAELEDKEGYVWDWDSAEKKLVNGETTVAFFNRLSAVLYGTNQSGNI